MPFHSFSFIVFFAVLIPVYYLVPPKPQRLLLLAASAVFYFAAGPGGAFFLFFTATSSFGLGLALEREIKPRKRRGLLIRVIALNLAVLGILKYAGFFTGLFGAPGGSLFLPLGISFYTLQAIGYCVDVYRGACRASRNFSKYLLFLSFFPHILQGPIARYHQLMPELARPHLFRYENLRAGLSLMLWGYFKKLVVADRAAILVGQVYGNTGDYAGLAFWAASVCYSLQIYADFSGCMDIARGAAQVLGISLAENFDHPYFAVSIQDFWRRWHISLSSWLRDYVYIPLGGSHHGTAARYRNILLVFLVSGLWHGAGWNFILWGLLHGLYQVAGAVTKPARQRLWLALGLESGHPARQAASVLSTLFLVNLAWIFFRVGNVKEILHILYSMFTVWNPGILLTGQVVTLGLDKKNLLLLACAALVMWLASRLQEKIHIRETLAKQPLAVRWGICLAGIFAVLIFGAYGIGYSAADFIYMNF